MEFINVSQAKKQTGLSYLGRIDSSSKIQKNSTVFKIQTYSLYLSPAKVSGYDVCPFSTVECRMGCLATSGRAIGDIISKRNMIETARTKKLNCFLRITNFLCNGLLPKLQMPANYLNYRVLVLLFG